jgi:hypothetical protein
MIECYKNGKSIEYYIKNFVDNLDFKSNEELNKIAEDNVNELYNRYIDTKTTYNDNNIIYNITTYEYIKQNYKDKLLFYTVNHPTKYVIQFICEKIIDILKIPNTINYNIDVLDCHGKCILYKCISKNVNFDINNHIAEFPNSIGVHNVTKIYYDIFKKNGFK